MLYTDGLRILQDLFHCISLILIKFLLAINLNPLLYLEILHLDNSFRNCLKYQQVTINLLSMLLNLNKKSNNSSLKMLSKESQINTIIILE